MKRALGVVWLAGSALACLSPTVPIPGPRMLVVPTGSTRQAFEVAVLAGVDDVVVPPAYDPKRELPPAEFQTMLDQDYLSRTRSGVWFPEWGSEGIRYASVDSWQEYHLLVCIHMTTNEVRIEYVESRNM